MDAKFLTSEKDQTLIDIGGYTFCYHKMLAKNTLKRWQCTKRTCKAFLKTNSSGDTIIERVLDHNHEKLPENLLNRQQLSNSVKRAAVSDICEKPIKLIRTQIKNSEMDTITTKDIEMVRKNIHRARSASLIKLPKNISEFHSSIETVPILTNRDEMFLLKNDKENNIIIFSCKTNLFFLSSASHLFVDGTFEYCPKYFLQLFTIHGLKNDRSIPLVFCLLPNKTTASYNLVFKYLKEECLKLNLPLTPETITADFESAIHKAISQAFTQTAIRGCRFHLGQSFYRKIKEIGLSTAYQNKSGEDTEISTFLTYIFGLPFLDPKDVGDVFALDLAEIKPEDQRVTKFCDYLVENYIDSDSMFPPHIWAEHSASLQKTTNACESFHSKYNSSFYCAHPNINVFLNVLLGFQIDTYIKINSIQIVPKIDSQTLHKQHFVQGKLNDLKDKKIDKFEFVKAVSYRFKAHVF